MSAFTYDRSGSLPLILSDGQNSFVYGPNGLPVEQVSSAGVVSYTHQDQAGSTRLVTSATGVVSGTATYNAYGLRTAVTGTVSSLGFQGQYSDAETGLIWMRARMYDPATGQFMQRDPLTAQTRSPYAYANNDPLNSSDPSGLCTWLTRNGDSCAHSFQNFLLDSVAPAAGNGLAGAASTVSGGATDSATSWLGASSCSTAYKVGSIAGYGILFVPGLGEADAAVEGAIDVTTVGRWMSPAEHEAMIDTGMVQEGAGGTTYVAHPSDIDSYMGQAKAGTRYVEFDVPADSVVGGGKEGWAQISGPSSLRARKASLAGNPAPQFPAVSNIQWLASRISP